MIVRIDSSLAEARARMSMAASEEDAIPFRAATVSVLGVSLSLAACSPGLSTKGEVRVSLADTDTGLASAAEKEGIKLTQTTSTATWHQRLLADLQEGSAAQLYASEWSRELSVLSREGQLAETSDAWSKSGFADATPGWFGGMIVGPLNGFFPTSAYVWGLFINAEKLSELGVSPPVDLPGLESLFAKSGAAGTTPISLGTAYGWPGAAWFTMLDLRMNDAEAVLERYRGKRRWDDEGGKAVAGRLADWRDKGYFSPGASNRGMPESISSVETGDSLCVLMGAFAADRLRRMDKVLFIAFPRDPDSKGRAELIGLFGFAAPKAGFSSMAPKRIRTDTESAVALVDRYLLEGYGARTEDSYRVPLVYATELPGKRVGRPLPEISGMKASQAELLLDAEAVVPSFERAVSSQAVQNTIPLWSAFFGEEGGSGQDFVIALQKMMEAGK